jgi:hypothetical protein
MKVDSAHEVREVGIDLDNSRRASRCGDFDDSTAPAQLVASGGARHDGRIL